MIKLIAGDLDGTPLLDDKTVLDRTRAALYATRARGKVPRICSGAQPGVSGRTGSSHGRIYGASTRSLPGRISKTAGVMVATSPSSWMGIGGSVVISTRRAGMRRT